MTATLVDVWNDRVTRSHDRIACICGEDSFTYGEIDRQSVAVAQELQLCGVRSGDRVGLCSDRGIEAIVFALAIFRCGASYVAIDVVNPVDRVEFILHDAGVTTVVADRQGIALLWGIEGICLVDGVAAVRESTPARVAAFEPCISPLSEAYVVYTSGSTGSPKGCAISHLNVLSLLNAALPLFQLDSQDVWSMAHSLAFDFSIWELWAAVSTGATLHVLKRETLIDSEVLARELAISGVTILSIVPSVFSLLLEYLDESACRVRYCVFGGEMIRPADVIAARRILGDCRFVNMYGLSEGTVHSTFKLLGNLQGWDSTRTPIGVPLDNCQIRIVDALGNAAAETEVGEIVIAGSGVAHGGYIGHGADQNSRFSTLGGLRCFSTGDLGVRHGSEFYYVGRVDRQVKHCGYRIELDEIELALGRLNGVRTCAVHHIRGSKAPNGQVVAAVQWWPHMSFDLVECRRLLQRWLPIHMLPERLFSVDKLPSTNSGKRDRAGERRMIIALTEAHASCCNGIVVEP